MGMVGERRVSDLCPGCELVKPIIARQPGVTAKDRCVAAGAMIARAQHGNVARIVTAGGNIEGRGDTVHCREAADTAPDQAVPASNCGLQAPYQHAAAAILIGMQLQEDYQQRTADREQIVARAQSSPLGPCGVI